MFRIIAGLLLVVVTAIAGCGATSRKLETFPVRGKVVVGPWPAEGALVVFHSLPAAADHPEPGQRPSARVAADGGYTLTTHLPGDGAPAGEYAVTVTWRVRRGKSSEDSGVEADSDFFRGRYRDPQTTPLRARVTPGTNEIPTFVLR